VDVVLAPPFPALQRVGRALDGSGVALAAQNVHPEAQGAFTGEVSAGMLRDLGCAYAIVGHSERRGLFGETSEFVARKAAALLAAEIRPIVCVGETLEQREAGRTFDVVGEQLSESLSLVEGGRAPEVVVAYEPVWAIGTGRTATPEMAQEVHAFVRSQLRERFGDAASELRIQYGGSVKPDNVRELMAQPDIDGALVGGASLAPKSFAEIVLFER
jgi:triosephosphate isomerase